MIAGLGFFAGRALPLRDQGAEHLVLPAQGGILVQGEVVQADHLARPWPIRPHPVKVFERLKHARCAGRCGPGDGPEFRRRNGFSGGLIHRFRERHLHPDIGFPRRRKHIVSRQRLHDGLDRLAKLGIEAGFLGVFLDCAGDRSGWIGRQLAPRKIVIPLKQLHQIILSQPARPAKQDADDGVDLNAYLAHGVESTLRWQGIPHRRPPLRVLFMPFFEPFKFPVQVFRLRRRCEEIATSPIRLHLEQSLTARQRLEVDGFELLTLSKCRDGLLDTCQNRRMLLSQRIVRRECERFEFRGLSHDTSPNSISGRGCRKACPLRVVLRSRLS